MAILEATEVLLQAEINGAIGDLVAAIRPKADRVQICVSGNLSPEAALRHSRSMKIWIQKCEQVNLPLRILCNRLFGLRANNVSGKVRSLAIASRREELRGDLVFHCTKVVTHGA